MDPATAALILAGAGQAAKFVLQALELHRRAQAGMLTDEAARREYQAMQAEYDAARKAWDAAGRTPDA